MRLIRLLSVVVFAASLVACGGSDDEAAEDTTTTEPLVTTTTEPLVTTTTGPAVLDSGQLDAAVLTEGDLPPGWVDDPNVFFASQHGGRLCPAGRDELKAETHEGRAVAFARSLDAGPFLEQAITTMPDTSEHFADHKNSLTSCVGQTWSEDTPDGETASLSLVEISAPSIGDEQAAFRLNLSYSGGYSNAVEYVLIRNGTVLEEYWGDDDEIDPFSPGEFAGIVERGNDKVSEAAGAD